jgi:hypothetical protein
MINDVNVSYKSSLVRSTRAFSSVDASRKFQVAAGVDDVPLLFSLGGDGAFYLTTSRQGQSAAWKSYNLSTDLGGGGAITTFQVAQDPQTQNLTLFLATLDAEKVAHLYRTQPLPQSFDGTVSQEFWTEIPLLDAIRNMEISGIFSSGQGIVIATRSVTPVPLDAQYYSVTDGVCQALTLPADASEIYDIRTGQLGTGLKIPLEGYFLLYNAGSTQTPSPQLIFQTLPSLPHGTETFLYELPDGFLLTLDSIAVLPPVASTESSILYAAGDGVLECTSPTSFTTIVPPVNGVKIKAVRATRAGENISLFLAQETTEEVTFLSQTNNYSITDHSGNSAWLPAPVLIANDVVEFDGILAQSSPENQLVCITSTDAIQHLSQSARTGTWTSSPILIESTSTTRGVTAYVSLITLGTEDQVQQIEGQSVFFSSSVATTVLINDASHHVGPTNTVEIVLDSNILYVEYQSDQFSSVALYMTSPLFAGTQVVDVSHGLCTKLRALNSADALVNAKKKDGTPLIPNALSIGENNLGQFATALQSILDFRETLIQRYAASLHGPLEKKFHPAGLEEAVAIELPLWGGSETETVAETVVLETCEAGGDVAIAGGPAGVLIGAGIVLAAIIVGGLILALESKPPSLVISLVINGDTGTLTIKKQDDVTHFDITDDVLALAAILMMFRSLGVSSRDLTDSKTDEYTSELLIYLPGTELAWNEASIPVFEQPSSSIQAAGPAATCAVGAEVNLWWRIRVNGQPADIVFAAWTVRGRQIDLTFPLQQDQYAGTGDPIRDLVRSQAYVGGNPALLPVAWLDFGDLPVGTIGFAGAEFVVVRGDGVFTVVAPAIQDFGEMWFNFGYPQVNHDGKFSNLVNQLYTNMPAIFDCPLAPGPGQVDVLRGGTVGYVQVVTGTRTRISSKGLVPTQYAGQAAPFLDVGSEWEDSVFYKAETIVGLQVTLDTDDQPSIPLVDDADTESPTFKYDEYYVNRETFRTYVAFKAPEGVPGVVRSYVVTKDGWSWGWTGGAKYKASEGWSGDNLSRIGRQPLFPTEEVEPRLVTVLNWQPPKWASNTAVLRHWRLGP